ncbi:creatininase family protein [Shimia aestuarii]|uniref:creatininase family protein n=1 Tax=Shimia aestuarii TaxID=254406 RepID=UPI001FB514EF|nr:creatininase family protein [Shimia aestuarii]
MPIHAYWAALKAPDFETLPDDTVAILPFGATEQHGPHLPLSVDTTLTDAVLSASLPHWSAATNALILPTLTITKSNEHAEHAGSLALSARTLLSVIEDIGASVARAGIRRLVMLNGHGGNTAVLEIACRELRIAHRLVTAHASWFAFAETSPHIAPEAAAHDLHAGDIETSAMLAAAPNLVDMDKADDFPPKTHDWQANNRWTGLTGHAARPGWVIDDLSPSGACGDASVASADKGAAMIESAAKNFAAFLEEFSRFDPAH